MTSQQPELVGLVPRIAPMGQKKPLPPFQGKTLVSRHASYTGAVATQPTRGEKVAAYLQILKNHGPITDQDVAALTHWPLGSVNSIRNCLGTKVVPCGLEPSPFRKATRTRWGLR